MKRTAFSLLEILVVMAILSLLAALLFPAFWTAQGRARQASCVSNLRQIGASFQMYMQDSDGRYPYAVDPLDHVHPSAWPMPFEAEVPSLPLIQDVLLPYSPNKALYRCPADIGYDVSDFADLRMDAYPSSFEKYGTSYYYRTEVAATCANESFVSRPEKINLVMDGAGHWHGTLFPLAKRYNVLFADGHVKNISYEEITRAWQTPLSGIETH